MSGVGHCERKRSHPPATLARDRSLGIAAGAHAPSQSPPYPGRVRLGGCFVAFGSSQSSLCSDFVAFGSSQSPLLSDFGRIHSLAISMIDWNRESKSAQRLIPDPRSPIPH
jgi:hypothetical protein